MTTSRRERSVMVSFLVKRGAVGSGRTWTRASGPVPRLWPPARYSRSKARTTRDRVHELVGIKSGPRGYSPHRETAGRPAGRRSGVMTERAEFERLALPHMDAAY